MSANIEALVKKHIARNGAVVEILHDALTEQAETHALELRAYEATVQNLEQRIREIEAQRVPVVGNDIPQDWKGVDGAVAWHLMDRHGEGWAHIGQMMDEWAAANAAQFVPVVGDAVAYLLTRDDDKTFPRAFTSEKDADSLVAWSNVAPLIVKHNLYLEPTTSIPAAELASLREKAAEADELRKDAERYRWLRDDAFEHSNDCFMAAGQLFAEHHGATFDAAIDAAIAQERQP